MLILIKIKCLAMSILMRIFALEIEKISITSKVKRYDTRI